MELDFSNEDLEKILFKKALTDKSWLNILSNIFDKRWCKSEYVGLELSLSIKYYNKYNVCPSNNVIMLLVKKYASTHETEEIDLARASEVLSEVSSMKLAVDEDIITKNLQTFIKKNAFYNSLYDNAEILTKSPDSYELVVDKCLANFEKVQRIMFNDNDIGMNYFNEADMIQHWKFINNPEAKIKTGWDSLDKYTNGGVLRDGRMLALIMAQAGLGKSVFMSNLAVNFLKQNLSVVVISLEMSQDSYAQRFDAHISGKNINKLNEDAENAVKRIKDFYAQHPNSNLFIKEYPPKSIKTTDIQCYLENLQNAGHKFDVVVIDYLNLVLPRHSKDNMFMDGKTVSEELRALSYKFKVPFISAVQCNSDGMNSEDIDMQNVSESRGIVHTADALVALYRTEKDRENGIIYMKILKNRLGGQEGKTCMFKMDPENLTVSDVSFDADFRESLIEDNDTEIKKITNNLPQLSSAIGDLMDI